MTEEERTRLLGCRDGLNHALIAVGSLRSAITGPAGAYLPPQRHTRKRAVAATRLAELDRATDVIRQKLDDVREALSNI